MLEVFSDSKLDSNHIANGIMIKSQCDMQLKRSVGEFGIAFKALEDH